jgi:hypothetical protein
MNFSLFFSQIFQTSYIFVHSATELSQELVMFLTPLTVGGYCPNPALARSTPREGDWEELSKTNRPEVNLVIKVVINYQVTRQCRPHLPCNTAWRAYFTSRCYTADEADECLILD